MASSGVDPGRPSEILQAEYLKQFKGQKQADQPPAAAPGVPQAPASAPPIPDSLAAPPAEEKKLSVDEFDKTGKLPLEALPTEDIVKFASASGINLPPKPVREDVIAKLKSKGISEIAVEK